MVILSTKLQPKFFIFYPFILIFAFLWPLPNSLFLKCGKCYCEHYIGNMTSLLLGACEQAIFGVFPSQHAYKDFIFPCSSRDQAVAAWFVSKFQQVSSFILDSISSVWQNTRHLSLCFLWQVIFLSQILFTQFERLDLVQEIRSILFPFH